MAKKRKRRSRLGPKPRFPRAKKQTFDEDDGPKKSRWKPNPWDDGFLEWDKEKGERVVDYIKVVYTECLGATHHDSTEDRRKWAERKIGKKLFVVACNGGTAYYADKDWVESGMGTLVCYMFNDAVPEKHRDKAPKFCKKRNKKYGFWHVYFLCEEYDEKRHEPKRRAKSEKKERRKRALSTAVSEGFDNPLA